MAVGLKYIDEEDKCYGIAGMAIGMMICDSEKFLKSLSLDAPVGESIKFTNDFYFEGDPHMSAKSSWSLTVELYQLAVGMLIANVMCRNCVLRHDGVTSELKNLVYKHINEEGKTTCSLESDEIKHLFDKNFSYMYRIFNHQGVQSIVHDFVRCLKQKRSMLQSEVIEELRALSML